MKLGQKQANKGQMGERMGSHAPYTRQQVPTRAGTRLHAQGTAGEVPRFEPQRPRTYLQILWARHVAYSFWRETSGWTVGFRTGSAGVRVDPTQRTSGTLPRDARRLRHALSFTSRRVAVSFSLLRVFQISRC